MNEVDRFELAAKTFHRVTGYLRPGKDQPSEMLSPTEDERRLAWDSYLRLRKFHNLLRALLNLDYHDVDAAMNKDEWPSFRDNPHQWIIAADDRQQWELWQAVEKRATSPFTGNK